MSCRFLPGERKALSKAVRAIRKMRGLRTRDVARAMGMALRTYEDFEAGRGPLDHARLAAFASATNCDLAALVLCGVTGNSELAVRSADNKAVTVALMMLETLDEVTADGLSQATAATLLRASEAFLGAIARPSQTGEPARLPLLTPRQVECLRWVQAGKSSGDIGAILGLSPSTVNEYIAEACARLGVRTRVQAISKAIGFGFLSP